VNVASHVTRRVEINGMQLMVVDGLFAEADIGGFGVNSDSTWQAQGGVEWDVTRHFYLRATYRYLATDYDNDNFVYDVALGGPQLEIGFRF